VLLINRAYQILYLSDLCALQGGLSRRLGRLGYDQPMVAEHLFQVPPVGLDGPAKNRFFEET
jgi:hypothetical protein